jgi:hypothetical protein
MLASAGHDDVGRLTRGDHGERHWQLVETFRRQVDAVGYQTEPRTGGEEGRLVEPGCRDRRQAADIGLADRPADLLGDVEQRAHQRIDRPASVAGPNRWLEPAILQRGHFPSAPADLLLRL